MIPLGLTSASINAASLSSPNVTLQPATYIVSEPVLLRPGSFVSGHRTATILEAAPGYAGPIVANVPPQPGHNFTRDLRLSGVTIRGNGYGADTVGLQLRQAAESVIEEVRITACGLAVEVDDGIMNTFRQCKIFENGRGVELRNRANCTSFHQTRVQSSKQTNVLVCGPNTFTVGFHGCAIESSGIDGGASPGLILDSGVKGVLLQGCHFESNQNAAGGQIVIRNTNAAWGASTCNIRDGWMTGNNKAKYAIEAVDCLALVVDGVTTAGHETTVFLGAAARADLMFGLLSDQVNGWTGAAPYSVRWNGTVHVKDGFNITSSATSRIKKASGALSIEAPIVYVNGQRFNQATTA